MSLKRGPILGRLMRQADFRNVRQDVVFRSPAGVSNFAKHALERFWIVFVVHFREQQEWLPH